MRSALTASLLLLALAGPSLPGCRQAAEPPQTVRPVRVVRVGDPTVLTGRMFPGRAEATQEVNLSFRVSGPLITRDITVGQEVVAGTVLAAIDPRDFEVEQRNVEAQFEESRAAYALSKRLVCMYKSPIANRASTRCSLLGYSATIWR